MSTGSALEMWEAILWEIDCGIIMAGNYQLLTAALGQFPYNDIFLRLFETYVQFITDSPGSVADEEHAAISSTDSLSFDEPGSIAPAHVQNVRFSLTDRRDLPEELAKVFNTRRSVDSVLRVTDFPLGRILPFEGFSADDVWGGILHNIDCGAIRAGHYQLLTAAVRSHPDNPVFRRLAESYLGINVSQLRIRVTGHAFISYVRDDSLKVDALQQVLENSGVRVWRDTADLWPGEDWRAKIRHAITDDALVFLACFSHKSVARKKSYQNEELVLAIDQMRLRRPDEPWLIPVRFDDCDIPDFDVGGGRSFSSIQRADLFDDRFDEAAARLTGAVLRILGDLT
jgi:hypothetical protein